MSTLSNRQLTELVTASLNGIDADGEGGVAPGLQGASVRYVLTGEGPEVLLALRDVDNQTMYRNFAMPGSGWRRHPDDAVLKDPRQPYAGALRRIELYSLADRVPAEVFVRLGRVLFAISRTYEPLRDDVPSWLAALLFDVIHGARRASLADFKDDVPPLPGWTPDALASILLASGTSPEEVPAILVMLLFENASTSWSFRQWGLGRALPGSLAFAQAHLKVLMEVLPSRRVAGKQIFFTLLAENKAANQFAPVLALLLTDTSKEVRTEAMKLITTLDDDAACAVLTPQLSSVPASRVADVIDVLSRLESGAGLSVLRTALDTEPAGKRRDLITAALDRAEVLTLPVAELTAPPFEVLPDGEVPAGLEVAAQTAIDLLISKEQENLAKAEGAEEVRTWWAKRIREDLAALRAVNVATIRPYLEGHPVTAQKTTKPSTLGRIFGAKRSATVDPTSFTLPSMVVHQLDTTVPLPLIPRLRLLFAAGRNTYSVVGGLRSTDGSIDMDVRTALDAMTRAGIPNPDTALLRYCFGWNPEDLAPEHVWPFFVENPKYLEAGLLDRTTSPDYAFDEASALRILGTFPVLPAWVLPLVTSVAVRGTKVLRRQAQDLLSAHPGAIALAVGSLSDGALETRRSAAMWLGRLGDPAGVTALRAALAKEKQPVAKAAIIAALEQCGADISELLSPTVLLKEATVGLKAKLPTAVGWIPLNDLPACTWADGTPVPAEIIRWWVVFAVKLKDPAGADLLPRYVALLSPNSQQSLGAFVLTRWVAEDTRMASEQESRDRAAAEAPGLVQQYQRWAKAQSTVTVPSLDEATARLFQQYSGIYLGSATAQKGMLALACGVPGATLAQTVQSYVRSHKSRRSQVESLVTLLAQSEDVAARQLLMSISRRFPLKSVQEAARSLIATIAEQQGWTPDELADRTIPTGGFEDDGTLTLSFGPRAFTARLTPALGIELTTETGTIVKALPSPRASDDPETAKEAKAQFSATKKELKQVLTLQTSRLYEAMCIERDWSAEEWTELLLHHPVMQRLIGSLIWIAQTDETRVVFRPDAGGTLLDADDEDVTLPAGARVRLAHAVLLTSEEATAWAGHLTDYRVTPLFDQLTATAVPTTPGAMTIEDRLGWTSDTFTLRGAFTKRGFVRGNTGDGGTFDEYVKTLPGSGCEIVVEFTGSYLPEENMSASVTTLSFTRTDGRRRKQMPMTEVPPVLLAEAYRDYCAVAAVGAFDPAWKEKAPW